jgi:hypothetical protein
MMTCNGKALSKVMGWGMILKMIRDKYVTWGTRVGTVIDGTDQDHWVLRWFYAVEWRAYCHRLWMCGESSYFCMQEVVVFLSNLADMRWKPLACFGLHVDMVPMVYQQFSKCWHCILSEIFINT